MTRAIPLMRPGRHGANAIAVLLLSVHTGLLAWSAARQSPSLNEPGHLAAGLSHWQLRRFDLYRVNPPLVRMVASLPIVWAAPRMEWNSYSAALGARAEFACGDDFLEANGERSFWLFTLARWACIPFSVLAGYICYRWARALYGATASLVTLACWCFEPNVIAHGQMITPDMGATALGVAAGYFFWRWLRGPRWASAVGAGLVLGAAQLTKTTLLVLYALWPLAWAICRIARRHDGPRRAAGAGWITEGAQLGLVFVISVYVTNLGYGFERAGEPLGRFEFISRMFAGPRNLLLPAFGSRNRFARTPIAGIPVPLPANYLLGIDQQKFDFEKGYPSYFRGEWRQSGRWYYYLYAAAVKVPLGTLTLALLATILAFMPRVGAAPAGARGCDVVRRLPGWRDTLVLVLHPAAILTLVGSQTGINDHFRYALPALPFLFIWAGGVMRSYRAQRATVRCARAAIPYLVGGAVTWSAMSSLWNYPHSLSYFNEVARGPFGGRWWLLHSNIDWGQDLLYLRRWLDANPHARPFQLAYSGVVDPRIAGIEFALPASGALKPSSEHLARDQDRSSASQRGPLPGWHGVSVMLLHGAKSAVPNGKGGIFPAHGPHFTYFQEFLPVARAGYSIYIYHMGIAEANRVRDRLGIPLLTVPLPADDAQHQRCTTRAPSAATQIRSGDAGRLSD